VLGYVTLRSTFITIILNNMVMTHTSKRLSRIKIINIDGKDTAIPLQALTGSEGSRRLRLPDFKTIGT
jgi:hypothetical protein